jgi:hypothetical protein
LRKISTGAAGITAAAEAEAEAVDMARLPRASVDVRKKPKDLRDWRGDGLALLRELKRLVDRSGERETLETEVLAGMNDEACLSKARSINRSCKSIPCVQKVFSYATFFFEWCFHLYFS